MAPQHTDHRWFAVCLSIFLGVLSMNATAIDPGSVKGKLTYDGNVYPLQHVYAWQAPGQSAKLWVYVTDTKLPAAATRDQSLDSLPELADLQDEGRVHGVRLLIDPAKPDLNSLDLHGYAERRFKFAKSDGGPKWKRLLVGGKRVVGTLQYAGVDMLGLAWSLDVEFSAPVFSPVGGGQTSAGTKTPGGGQTSAGTKTPGSGQTSAGTKTLTGAQARKSPQAEVFLAHEKTLLTQGIDAAGVYMTPESLAEMKDQIKQFGADRFKEFQTKMRESTPQGEARRRQIEKVVVDGDKAVLTVRNGPNDVDEAPLVKLKEGWRIGK